VVLSFDLDAEYLWKVWLNGKPSLIDLSQGTYDIEVALPRVLTMLKRQGLRATFFVPGAIAEKYPEAVRSIVQEGHEVGHHGYKHEDFSKLTYNQERKAIEKGAQLIRDVCGSYPVGARLIPGKNTYALLAQLGFLYNSVLMDSDLPHQVNIEGLGTQLVELPVSFSFNDTAYFVYTFGMSKPLLTPRMVEEVFRDEFDAFYGEGGYCMFMLHPQVIGRPHRLLMLERTIEYMKSKGDVWFTTAKDVALHTKGFFLH
jgi:peptidoglycan/xylan/chitin deacetylase (PgdA/CDA1 family)